MTGYTRDGRRCYQSEFGADVSMDDRIKNFKENKTPGLSNTAVNSLLRADQVSYDDSIAPISENVKVSDKNYLSSKDDIAPIVNYSTPLNETALEQDIAPVAENATTTDDNVAPAEQTVDGL